MRYIYGIISIIRVYAKVDFSLLYRPCALFILLYNAVCCMVGKYMQMQVQYVQLFMVLQPTSIKEPINIGSFFHYAKTKNSIQVVLVKI